MKANFNKDILAPNANQDRSTVNVSEDESINTNQDRPEAKNVDQDTSTTNVNSLCTTQLQTLHHSLVQKTAEEQAQREMLDLQKDTEILSKVCPDVDPDYIFSRLEHLKDKPNRVALVNKEIVTFGGEIKVLKQKKVSWLWKGENDIDHPFADAESIFIECMYQCKEMVDIQFPGSTSLLNFDFKLMLMKEYQSKRTVSIQRTELLGEVVTCKLDNNDKK
jgi:hypothetical protein